MSASKLVRPDAEYKRSFLEALREYHAEDEYKFWDASSLDYDFESFVALMKTERGVPHRPYQEWVELVPETVAWLVKDDTYIGTVDIRHRLNWHLERWGGHITFTIRPSMRAKSFGHKILTKAMPIANYLGVQHALLTVDPANACAMAVIEACGGKFSDETSETSQFPARKRYWLDCT